MTESLQQVFGEDACQIHAVQTLQLNKNCRHVDMHCVHQLLLQRLRQTTNKGYSNTYRFSTAIRLKLHRSQHGFSPIQTDRYKAAQLRKYDKIMDTACNSCSSPLTNPVKYDWLTKQRLLHKSAVQIFIQDSDSILHCVKIYNGCPVPYQNSCGNFMMQMSLTHTYKHSSLRAL